MAASSDSEASLFTGRCQLQTVKWAKALLVVIANTMWRINNENNRSHWITAVWQNNMQPNVKPRNLKPITRLPVICNKWSMQACRHYCAVHTPHKSSWPQLHHMPLTGIHLLGEVRIYRISSPSSSFIESSLLTTTSPPSSSSSSSCFQWC